jgi:crotonobetainyl-CoA:carnitine CoA-transferase CaiB-like acyl-CoA transferase
MADLGAEVIGSSSGGPARRRGPYPPEWRVTGGERLFIYLNSNKKESLNPEREADREVLLALLEDADVSSTT